MPRRQQGTEADVHHADARAGDVQEGDLSRTITLAAKEERGDHRDAVSGHEREGTEDVEEDDEAVHGPIVGWLSRARLAMIG